MDKYIISVMTGSSQLPFLQKAVEKGYKIVGFDKNPEAPGRKYCTYFEVVDRSDAREAINWLDSLNLIYSGVASYLPTEDAQFTRCEIAKHFNLSRCENKELIKASFDKNYMDQILKDNKLDENKKFNNKNLTELINYLEATKESEQVVIKSINGYGSKNIIIKYVKELLFEIKNNNINIDQYIIEPYIEGKEYRSISFIQDGQIKLHDVIEKENFKGTLFTARFLPINDEKVPDLAMEFIQRLIEKLDIQNTMLDIDFKIVNEDIYIIEIDFGNPPSNHYEDLVSRHFYNFDYWDAYLTYIQGFPIKRKVFENQKEFKVADYLYNISSENVKLKEDKIERGFSELSKDYIFVPSSQPNTEVRFPKDNHDNYGFIMHNAKYLSNYEVCDCALKLLT